MKKKKYSKDFNGVERQNKQSFFKNKKNLSMIVVFGILGIMILSAISFSFLGRDNTEQQNNENNYNGYKFTQNNGYWTANLGGQNIQFQYYPSDLESLNFTDDYSLKDKIYIAFDPELEKETDPDLQRARGLLQTIKPQVFFSCTKEKGCADMPIIDCKNEQNSVIYFKETEIEENIHKEDNCLILEYNTGNKNKLVERLYYSLLGVMQ